MASSAVEVLRQMLLGKAVVSPNNSGKTTFLKTHSQIGWFDQDDFLKRDLSMGPQKKDFTPDQLQQADRLTKKYKMKGINLLVSAWWDYKNVDAFVIIDPKVLRERLDLTTFKENQRQAKHYATVAAKHNIPVFNSFERAILFLSPGRPAL